MPSVAGVNCCARIVFEGRLPGKVRWFASTPGSIVRDAVRTFVGSFDQNNDRLALLTFVPSRYPYPTQPGRLNRLMLLLSVPWTLVLATALIFDWDEELLHVMVRASVAYPAIYLGTAWAMSIRRRVAGSS